MGGLIDLRIVALQILLFGSLSVFWIWALIDCIPNETPDRKTAWAVVIALTHFLGALLYVIFGRRARQIRQVG